MAKKLYKLNEINNKIVDIKHNTLRKTPHIINSSARMTDRQLQTVCEYQTRTTRQLTTCDIILCHNEIHVLH